MKNRSGLMLKKFMVLMLIALPSIMAAQTALPRGTALLNTGLSHNLHYYVSGEFAPLSYLSIGFKFTTRKMDVQNDWEDFERTIPVKGFIFFANYHFNQLLGFWEDWDLYAGANVGLYRTNLDNLANYNEPTVSGGQVGGRYFFNEYIGVNLEAGYYNEAILKGGVTLRWN